MVKLKQAVLVEGKYDKIRLSNILDCLIIQTDGFGIFKNKEKQQFLKRLAKEKGIIIMTDSDSAGFVIRNFVCNIVGQDNVINVYMPDIFGKEKRKDAPSAEGKLGVEGIDDEIILSCLERFGVTGTVQTQKSREITNLDLYEYGLTGGDNSSEKRKILLKKLALPERMSKNNLLRTLNTFLTYEDFIESVKEL